MVLVGGWSGSEEGRREEVSFEEGSPSLAETEVSAGVNGS